MHVKFDLGIMQVALDYDGECELAVQMGMLITQVLEVMKIGNAQETLQKFLNFLEQGGQESTRQRTGERENQNSNIRNERQRFEFDNPNAYSQQRRRTYPQPFNHRQDRTNDSSTYVREDQDSSPPVVTIPRRSSNRGLNNLPNNTHMSDSDVYDSQRNEGVQRNGNIGYARGSRVQGNRYSEHTSQQEYRQRQGFQSDQVTKEISNRQWEPFEADYQNTQEEQKQRDLESLDVIIENLEKGGTQMVDAMERLAKKLKQNKQAETEFVEKLFSSMMDKGENMDCRQSFQFLEHAKNNRGENNQFDIFGRGKTLVRQLNYRLKQEFEKAVGGFGSKALQTIAYIRVVGQDVGVFDFYEIMEEVLGDYLDVKKGFEKFCAGLHQIAKFFMLQQEDLLKNSDFAAQIIAQCEDSQLDELRQYAGQDHQMLENLVKDIIEMLR